MIYAVKTTNLYTGAEHYKKARSYVHACDLMNRTITECEPEWRVMIDYNIEIVDVDDDFDFDEQPDFN